MGYGINEWSVSDLKGYLNTKYYGEILVSFSFDRLFFIVFVDI